MLLDDQLYELLRYDANGNRIRRETLTETTTATVDEQDRLLTYGPYVYTYTAHGELRTKTDSQTSETTTYTYDVRGNLGRVELPSGDVIEYLHDGLNRRVAKKKNGVVLKRWLYKDQLRIAAELDGSGNLVSRFVYASKSNVPDMIVRGGVTYRVLSDQLGSPRLVVNAANAADIKQQLSHDAFGNVLEDTNPGWQPFGFAGGLWDPETGLVRFGARDYDPYTGRWTAKDPSLFNGRTTNLYEYAGGDPVNRIDTDGEVWQFVVGCAALAYLAYQFYDFATSVDDAADKQQEANMCKRDQLDSLDSPEGPTSECTQEELDAIRTMMEAAEKGVPISKPRPGGIKIPSLQK